MALPQIMSMEDNILPTVHQDKVTNVNTQTILLNKPPSDFIANRPPPTDAVLNVYKLKAQLKLIWYYHSATGSPTKPKANVVGGNKEQPLCIMDRFDL